MHHEFWVWAYLTVAATAGFAAGLRALGLDSLVWAIGIVAGASWVVILAVQRRRRTPS